MSDALDALKAISNAIELKPNKKYLLVFKGDAIHHGELERISRLLNEEGIHGVGIALRNGQDLEVIEAPVMQEGDEL